MMTWIGIASLILLTEFYITDWPTATSQSWQILLLLRSSNIEDCAQPSQTEAQRSARAGANMLNPKFHAQAVGLTWSSYLEAWNSGQSPVAMVNWLLDYPDPHNFVYAFYHSRGPYGLRYGYNNPSMDHLITKGVATPDGPQRVAIYSQIQQLAIEDCAYVALATPISQHFEQTWINGWYHGPMYYATYAANLWKWYYTPHAQLDTVGNDTANLLPYDVNYDGRTNMVDIGTAAASFGGSYGVEMPISSKWNFRCDFNNDRRIDMKDIAAVAKNFGKTSATWNPS